MMFIPLLTTLTKAACRWCDESKCEQMEPENTIQAEHRTRRRRRLFWIPSLCALGFFALLKTLKLFEIVAYLTLLTKLYLSPA